MTLSRRDSELLLFDQVYQESAEGRGAVLLISGPVGTGKTALLQAMITRTGRQTVQCFVVTGSARERGNPYGVLDRLTQSMCVAGMTDPFPDGMNDGEDFFAMMDRLCTAFREFAGGRPVVVGIDDVHFADEQSLRCLSYLIRRIESCGVVMVLTESSSYERDMAALRAEMLHLSFCHRVQLTPLGSADIAGQLQQRFRRVPDRALVQYCAEVSGGIPLLLHALIDDRVAAPAPVADEPGPSFRQAVLRSLHRCAPSTATVAQAMAVLGDHATPELTAELCGVDVALVEEGMRDLREMGLVAAEQFRHPHTRSAVLAGIPLPDLPGMHSRAAELLHESGAPAIAGAEHLIAAQDGGKAPWRVAILCEAAREAMAAGDVDSAVSSLRHAVAAASDEAERARATLLLAEAQWHADPSRSARRLGGLSQDARAGLLTGRELLGVVNQLLWWGEFAEADELLQLGEAAEPGGSGLAQLWGFFCRVGSEAAGGCGEAGEPADSPLAGSGAMAAATYLSSAASLAFDGTRTSRADQMLLGIRAGTPLTPALYALVVLVQTGRQGEALTWCDRLLKEDWISRVPMRRAMIGTIRSVAALRDGDSAAALHCIREVFDAVPPSAWGVVAGLPLSLAVRSSTELGDAHTARSYLAVPVPPTMFGTPFALPYLQALGRYHLAMGHPESAFMHVRSCVDLARRWGVETARVASALAELDTSGPRPAATEEPACFDPRCGFEVGGRGEEGVRRSDEPPAGDGAKLTDAEQRVAALAAAGNTNRQIAEHLFITVSTVEQHLTKVYRKLNVRSRSELQRISH